MADPDVVDGRRPVPPRHPAGALGILHPFPSVLVSLVVAALAALAGGSPQVIVTLAVAMFGFQVCIGAVNDLADLDHDRSVGAAKPLPAGQVSVGAARTVAVAGAVTGLVLSALVGADILLVGAAGLACGIGYDLWLRTRGLAWLAYLAAIPLLVTFAWLGGAGTLPPSWPLLLPMAAAIGPALHLSNSLVDGDADAADPAGGLAGRLGRQRAIAALASLLVLVYGLAWVVVVSGTAPASADGAPASAGGAPATASGAPWNVSGTSLPVVGMLAATALAALGVGLSAGRSRQVRAMGWTVQATATALLGVSWVASIRP